MVVLAEGLFTFGFCSFDLWSALQGFITVSFVKRCVRHWWWFLVNDFLGLVGFTFVGFFCFSGFLVQGFVVFEFCLYLVGLFVGDFVFGFCVFVCC